MFLPSISGNEEPTKGMIGYDEELLDCCCQKPTNEPKEVATARALMS